MVRQILISRGICHKILNNGHDELAPNNDSFFLISGGVGRLFKKKNM